MKKIMQQIATFQLPPSDQSESLTILPPSSSDPSTQVFRTERSKMGRPHILCLKLIENTLFFAQTLMMFPGLFETGRGSLTTSSTANITYEAAIMKEGKSEAKKTSEISTTLRHR